MLRDGRRATDAEVSLANVGEKRYPAITLQPFSWREIRRRRLFLRGSLLLPKLDHELPRSTTIRWHKRLVTMYMYDAVNDATDDDVDTNRSSTTTSARVPFDRHKRPTKGILKKVDREQGSWDTAL